MSNEASDKLEKAKQVGSSPALQNGGHGEYPHIQNTQCIMETNTNLLNNGYFRYTI